jgi:hypothetical protein
MSLFDGKKYIYLSEVNDFGGTNDFMGIALLCMSAIVMIIMIVFTIMYFIKIRGHYDYYDPDYIEW